MDLLLCLEKIVSDFRPLFNQQNFMLFQALIFGFIANGGNGTLTSLYQSSFSQTRYWSFAKFLSRGKWDADAVATHLIKQVQQVFANWVYIMMNQSHQNRQDPMGIALFSKLQFPTA